MSSSNIFDISTYRAKKAEEKALVRGRTPLYTSHVRPEGALDFAERIVAIRQSIEKINGLLAELKKIQNDGDAPL